MRSENLDRTRYDIDEFDAFPVGRRGIILSAELVLGTRPDLEVI
jgi:hypothetical protein